METYRFEQLPVGSVDLSQRSPTSDLYLFAQRQAPIDQLVTIINEYNSDLKFEFRDGRTTLSCLHQMVDNAIGTSYQNAGVVLAATQFFSLKPVYRVQSLFVAIKLQPLWVIKWINQAIKCYDNEVTLVGGDFNEVEDWIQADATMNPDQRVAAYINYFFRTSDQQERLARLKEWDRQEEMIKRFQELETNPNCRLAYLVKDIRDYLIKPLLENFYWSI